MEQILSEIKSKLMDGGWDQEHWPKVEEFIRQRVAHYAEKLGVSGDAVLSAWEENRNYAAVNYYQDANFPEIDGETLLVESAEEFKEIVGDNGFICGACSKHISSPYECKKCGWKTYGLLGAGKDSLYVVLKPAMRGERVFRPVSLAKDRS